MRISDWSSDVCSSDLSYVLEGKRYRLLIARTPSEWEQGLMYRRSLDGADGMIFLFPDTQYRSFWNENTLVDLDLYWLSKKAVVGRSFLPSIEKSKDVVVVNSPKPADTVIELVR